MTTVYLIATVVLNLFMFTIWSKDGWPNFLIKFVALLLAVFGLFILVR